LIQASAVIDLSLFLTASEMKEKQNKTETKTNEKRI